MTQSKLNNFEVNDNKVIIERFVPTTTQEAMALAIDKLL